MKTTLILMVLLNVILGNGAFPTPEKPRRHVVRVPLRSEPNLHLREEDLSSHCFHRHEMGLRRLAGPGTAKCNDGSAGGYYLRRRTTSNRWVIFLQGGWYCSDESSCNARKSSPSLISSNQWNACMLGNGIISPSEDINPYLYDVNAVYIPYCSSDLWSGTNAAHIIGNETYSFMGALILEQVVRRLLLHHEMMKATSILLTGSSAGGTGVLLNIDRIQRLLSNAGSGAQLRGVADSGWYLLRPNMAADIHCNGTKCPVVSLLGRGLAAWQPNIPARCRDMFAQRRAKSSAADPQVWKCFFGPVVYEYIDAPLFVTQWMFDYYQIQSDNIQLFNFGQNSLNHLSYIRNLSSEFKSSLRGVNAVFAPACIAHAILEHSDLTTTEVNGVKLPEAIRCWEESLDVERRRRRRRAAKPDAVADDLLVETSASYWKQEEGYYPDYENQYYLGDEPAPQCTFTAVDSCCTPQCNPTCPSIYWEGTALSEDDLLDKLGVRMDTMVRPSGFESRSEFLRAFCGG